MPTQDKNSFHIRGALQINSLTLNLTKAQQLLKTSTHKLKNSSSQKLKLLSFILRYCSNFRSVLAKVLVKKLVKSHYFYPLTPWGLSIFKPKTCILHHLAFLVWLLTHIFSSPNTCFQPLKTYFLMVILPLLAMWFMVLKGFVYTIAVDDYTFRLAFCSIQHRVQHKNALRLAPKRTLFCTKTHCIQHQNTLRFAPFHPAFSHKQPQMWYKWQSF